MYECMSEPTSDTPIAQSHARPGARAAEPDRACALGFTAKDESTTRRWTDFTVWLRRERLKAVPLFAGVVRPPTLLYIAMQPHGFEILSEDTLRGGHSHAPSHA